MIQKIYDFVVGSLKIMSNKENNSNHFYPEKEERLNVLSHWYGFLCSAICFPFLIVKSVSTGDPIYIFSLTIFGITLMLMFLTSTMYHQSTDPTERNRYRMFDMFAIYTMIAGSYTPYALVLLKGERGWILFALIWGIALLGILWKSFTFGKYNLSSTFLYVAMGAICLFYLEDLIRLLPYDGLVWLIIGCTSYIVGVFFYLMDNRINYNHFIWHLFVIGGSFSHFISIFFYVLP